MRPVVVTVILLLVVLMFTLDSAAWDPAEMCRTTYPAKSCKNNNRKEWLQMGDNYCVKAFFNTEHLGFFAADIRASGLEWAWTDNTKFDYSRWAGGQPDNYQYSEGCVERNYWDWALWNNVNCKEKRPFVCAVKV
ncbi:C-type lectin LmsL-like [Etheostoma cragini]|uniref:C-type lectin LmsL-like n=1 Tax=Etheostoma cragini TaxID=417921 RepID=UPI00155F511F|nr:C-type lectin LmsL-like [Etheostoma cragini]